MADQGKMKKGSRNASLNAARKMLKEYQQTHTSKKPPKNIKENDEPVSQDINAGHVSNDNETPIDSMASSTHSSVNLLQEIQPQVQDTTVYTQQNMNGNNDHNFFNTALFQAGETNHLLSNYFDTLTKNNNDPYNENLQSVNDNRTFTEPVEALNNKYADPFEISNTPISNSNINDNVCQTIFNDNTCSENTDEIKDFNFGNVENLNENNVASQEVKSAFIDSANVDTVSTTENENHKTYSNAESLRQLSSQLTSLIDSEETIQNVSESELERRNQELASLLSKEQQKTEQLNLQNREYITRITQLETDLQQLQNEQDAKISREIGPLQEQLQNHVQSLGILVGERTELTMALNQSQATVKQKTAECEELQGRLRASRHRVSELEKEVNSLKTVKDNVDKNEQEYSRELERLKLEYGMLKDQFDEISDESLELREKLNIKTNESLTLQQELQEKNSQLSLAQLRIKQLTVEDNMHIESQLETLNQQKISLEQQVAELKQTVKLVSSERDQASQQYQQYVQQLNIQLQNLAGQLQERTKENEMLSTREQSLVKHIGELEKHLQQLQTEQQNLVSGEKANETPLAVRELEENIKNLQTQKQDLEKKLDKETVKCENLSKDLLEKNLLIEKLEFKVEQIISEQPDAGKLLAAMESDKIAAARATEQNQKLKDQLVELQEGFVKMSNSKLELTEKLESEQYRCREVSEKLSRTETDIEKLYTTINFKDKELVELQSIKTELNKQILQQNQLLDRLRHYEAQGNVMDLLQQELKESNKNLQNVMAENAELNQIISDLHNKQNMSDNVDSSIVNKENVIEPSGDNIESNDNIAEGIRKKIELLENTNAELEKRIKDISNNDGEDEVKSAQYLDREKAMEQLEERFTKTMADVAELTEEKQRLEHLVLQLQCETETIGEYVTLYQCQRAMLKQKTQEKDEQLERLEKDRGEMKLKLEELNNLVRKLVLEKGDIPEELLDNKIWSNYNYCELHSSKEKVDDVRSNQVESNILNSSNNENNNLGTAGQIIALLSEIKTSSLVQPGAENIQNFHPCPCCSGKLITV